MRNLSLWLLVATGLAMAGCSRDRAPTLDSAHIRESLRVLPQDSVLTLAVGDTLRLSPATLQFYDRRRGRPAWAGDDELLERGQEVLNAIARAEEDGLSPARYRYDVAQRLVAALEREGEGELSDSLETIYLADLDLVITEGFNRFANDLVQGTIDPEESGVDWEIPRGTANEQRVLDGVIRGTPPEVMLSHLRPNIPYYDRLRTALASYRSAQARGGWPQVPENVTLKEGVRNAAVAQLRQRLIAGTDSLEAQLARAGQADPTLFDARLKQAVERFQERHAIEADGAIGTATLRELNHTVEERIAELKLNLDRWRWMPDDLGERFVLVNVAGFELEVVDGGSVIEAMNVVVGKPSWQTPVFADTIEHIVVNPYWNVPESIAQEEVIPAVQRDPGYLARNNMEFVDGRYRQRPGPNNALGVVKILFPNEHDVYLHDTPHDALFSRTRRDFSHGCIRLERPRDLAKLLLRLQTDRNPEEFDRLVGGGEKWINLERKLPVYVLYFTAWADQDGTVHFYHDVYGRDEELATQARKLASAPGERLPGDKVTQARVGQDARLAN